MWDPEAYKFFQALCHREIPYGNLADMANLVQNAESDKVKSPGNTV